MLCYLGSLVSLQGLFKDLHFDTQLIVFILTQTIPQWHILGSYLSANKKKKKKKFDQLHYLNNFPFKEGFLLLIEDNKATSCICTGCELTQAPLNPTKTRNPTSKSYIENHLYNSKAYLARHISMAYYS